MASKVQDVGYDLNSVEDIPEYLLCVICHLALRRPVQVIDCSHKFCECCFESMKVISVSRATDLCCPLDREVIDPSKVFPDKFMERKVFDLQVKCDNIEKSCKWTGELRSLQFHLNVECLYQVDTCKHLGCGVELERGRLNEHMETCKRKIDSGIIELFRKFQNIIEEQKAEIVKLKHGYAKQQAELDRSNTIIKDQCDKVLKLEGEVENHKKELERYNEIIRKQDEKIIRLDNKIEGQKSECDKNHQIYDKVTSQLKTQTQSELVETRKIMNEQQVCLNSIRSMLNILSDENPVFVWKISNQWHVASDEPLYSPVFYTSLRGYRVHLRINWRDSSKKRLEVYLGLSYTQYFDELEWPFKKKWTIEYVDKSGTNKYSCSYDTYGGEISSDVLHKTGMEVGGPYLSMPELENYIINNRVTLKCWFD